MRLSPLRAAAVAVDFQEKLLPPIQHCDRLLQKSAQLIEGLSLLSVPLLFTEQYSKGLGPTTSSLLSLAPQARIIEKNSFGAGKTPAFLDALAALDRRQIILFGIEAHVCVLQTALDLLDAGYQPILAVDCISSRATGDLRLALLRAQQEGVLLSSCEAILFELTGSKEHPTFREISALVKRSALYED